MPIEIRELVIKTTVGGNDGGQSANPMPDTKEIIENCVEQVLEIIERKKDR